MFSSFRAIQEVPVSILLFTANWVLYFIVASHDPQFSTETLLHFGAHSNPHIWQGDTYRLVTSGFLHGGLLHIFLNNLALLNLGEIVERIIGSFGFLVLYIVSMVVGNLFSLLWMPPLAVSVGASGAIMGIAGLLCAFLLLDSKNTVLVTTQKGKYFFFALVGLNFLMGEWFEVINNVAHLGGFVAGFALGIFFWFRSQSTLPLWISYANAFLILAGISTLTYFGLVQKKENRGSFTAPHFEAFFLKDPHKALDSLEKWSNPKKPVQWLTFKGQIAIQQKNWKEAETFFSKLVKLQPSSQEHKINLMLVFSHLKKENKADALLQELAGGFSSLSKISLGILLAHRLKEKEAIDLYQTLLEKKSSDPSIHNQMAWLLVQTEDPLLYNPQLALYHAKQAVQNAETPQAAFLDTLATVYSALNQNKKAISIIQQALKAPGKEQIFPHLTYQLKSFQKKLPKATTKSKK